MRTLKAKEIAKYYREFPFLEAILDQESARMVKQFRLSVLVSVADAESLFIIPRFCLPPHWIGSQDGKYVGRVQPIVYAFDDANKVVKSMAWGYNRKDSFLKEVITGASVKTVALVRKYTWFLEVKDWLARGLDTYVGAFSHHEYQTIIFKKPQQGFSKLIQESDLTKNVPINDLLAIGMAGYRQENEATRAMKELESLVDKFERSIAPRVWAKVNKCKRAGMSGVFGKTELRTFATAGRIMFSFWSGKDQITFVGDESDYTRTGLQSMNCTVDMAKFIVQQVIDNWEASKLQAKDKISFG